MATGERTQMSAIKILVVSPLWNGELAPKDERPNLASHEHAMNGEPGQRRISSPGQAVFAQGHISVGQPRLQLLNHGPLGRRGNCRISTNHLQIRSA